MLKNTCTTPLTIKQLTLTGESPEKFVIPQLDLPETLAVDAQLSISMTFVPNAEEIFSAELEIIHNAGTQRNTVLLRGAGKTQTGSRPTRLYPDVPYVAGEPAYEPLERSSLWKVYAGISAGLLIITILYAIYLRRLRKGPQDKKPDYDENAPKMFHPGTIGGTPEARLDQDTLCELADSMGYFKSAQPGRKLNVAASIKAT
ncbi:MAG: hypothetical protein GY792_33625, partial [Gammaproteobacteria bacterium]|nr:hypothetical protein [Gammaproteobacteria bacterium]